MTEIILTDHHWRALYSLREALEYAHASGRDVWDFAVEIAWLRERGLSNSDLRWLVCEGYIESATEVTAPGEERRRFVPCPSLQLSNATCFVLASLGRKLTQQSAHDRVAGREPVIRGGASGGDGRPDPAQFLDGNQHEESGSEGAGRQTMGRQDRGRPIWDCERREVRVNGQLVKRFRLPSPNQEVILAAFEEEGWPPRIDDPLPPTPDMHPKRRLQDAIKGLNRNQKYQLLQFMGDGTGLGICWKLVAPGAEVDR